MPLKSPKQPTSGCCCLGVKCKCPRGKVCPSRKRDKNVIKKYIAQNKLTEEQKDQYISSLYKSMKKTKKSTKKSAKKPKKSAKKPKKSAKKGKKSAKKGKKSA
jgi:hypothetical protein